MAKDLTTTEFEPIQPEGLALNMLVVTILMTVISSIVVCTRFYVRITVTSFSTEDWLMLAGWVSCHAAVSRLLDGTTAAHLCRR